MSALKKTNKKKKNNVEGDMDLVNSKKCKQRLYYETLKNEIPNMILHEISNLNMESKKYFLDDFEDDLKIVQEMEKYFKKAEE